MTTDSCSNNSRHANKTKATSKVIGGTWLYVGCRITCDRIRISSIGTKASRIDNGRETASSVIWRP